MKVTLLLCLFAVCAVFASMPPAPDPLRDQFVQYLANWGKNYNPSEFNQRFSYFQGNIAEINDLNQKNPLATFGHTHFSDWSKDEFMGFLTNTLPNKRDFQFGEEKNFSIPVKPHDVFVRGKRTAPNPTTYDWSSAGVITPVYNQNQCGCCWAFSATETVESYYALAGNPLTQLSMQQLVDCDTNDGGCGGGNPFTAYTYIKSAGGLDSYSSYPYTSGNGAAGTCKFNKNNIVANVASYQTFSSEAAMYAQLSSASGGPVSVQVDATTWQNYQSGTITSCTNNLNHAVQVTGYVNYGQSGAYWNVRNQWGTSWGMNGYIHVAIGQNLCMIGSYGSSVTIAPTSGGSTTSSGTSASTTSATTSASTTSKTTTGTTGTSATTTGTTGTSASTTSKTTTGTTGTSATTTGTTSKTTTGTTGTSASTTSKTTTGTSATTTGTTSKSTTTTTTGPGTTTTTTTGPGTTTTTTTSGGFTSGGFTSGQPTTGKITTTTGTGSYTYYYYETSGFQG